MKLINPILITLHNTLHIKADNLEPVEVDSSCLDELSEIVYNKTKYQSKHPSINYYLLEGINISELSDMIEVRKIYVHKRESLNNFVYRAFLLPEKDEVKEMYVIVFNNGHKNYVGMNIHDSIDNCYEAIGLSYDTKHLGIFKLVKVN